MKFEVVESFQVAVVVEEVSVRLEDHELPAENLAYDGSLERVSLLDQVVSLVGCSCILLVQSTHVASTFFTEGANLFFQLLNLFLDTLALAVALVFRCLGGLSARYS